MVATLALVTVLLLPVPRDETRAAVPTTEQVESSRRLVDAMYKDELAATAKPAQAALGRKMLARSREPDTEAALRFVLLSLARGKAAEADDETTAFAAIDDLVRTYALDLAAEKVTFVQSRASKASAPESLAAGVEFLLADVPACLAREDLATATRLLDGARATAALATDPALAQRVAPARARCDLMAAKNDEFVAAQSKLKEVPADPHANQVVGYRFAVLEGRWDAGLPLLVQGDVPDLAGAAALELKSKSDAASRVAVADRWYDAAGKQPSVQQTALRAHAAALDRRWFPELKDPERQRVATRLAEIDPPPSTPKTTLKFDPAEWRLFRRPNGEWKPFPVDGSICSSKGAVFAVKNPGDPGGHAKLVYLPRALDGDFTLWLRYRGQIHVVSIGDDHWKERIVYIEPMPCDRTEWRSLVMRRTREGLTTWIDGEPGSLHYYNADDFLAGNLCVELKNGQEIELKDFALRGGLSR
jgi:hypothetical protein